jgi:hypothetical protein
MDILMVLPMVYEMVVGMDLSKESLKVVNLEVEKVDK